MGFPEQKHCICVAAFYCSGRECALCDPSEKGQSMGSLHMGSSRLCLCLLPLRLGCGTLLCCCNNLAASTTICWVLWVCLVNHWMCRWFGNLWNSWYFCFSHLWAVVPMSVHFSRALQSYLGLSVSTTEVLVWDLGRSQLSSWVLKVFGWFGSNPRMQVWGESRSSWTTLQGCFPELLSFHDLPSIFWFPL